MKNFADLTPNEQMQVAMNKIVALQSARRQNLNDARYAMFRGRSGEYTKFMQKAEQNGQEIAGWHKIIAGIASAQAESES